MQRLLAIEEAQTANRTRIPYIRLRGKWLGQLGFQPGDRVVVTAPERGVLHLHVKETVNSNPPGLK
jgi:hypothetical protein